MTEEKLQQMRKTDGRKHPPIRIGIMCKGNTFAEWEARCIENVLALDDAQAILLIVDDTIPSKLDRIKEVLSNSNRILFCLYRRFVCRPRTTRPVDITNLMSGVPSLRRKSIKEGKSFQHLSAADIEVIRGYDLDLILKFGFGVIRGEILNVPRFGIWSFYHDDEEKYRGGPPCFWEIYRGDDVTGAILERLTDWADGNVVLKKGFFGTVKYSYARNIDQCYYESAKWPAQVCIDIRNGNADYLNALPSGTKAPIYHVPNGLQMLLFITKMFWNGLTLGWQTLFQHEQWNIGIIYEPIHSLIQADARPKIHWLPTPKRGKFLADPFGIVRNKEITVICEEFDYRSGKGRISCIELSGDTFSSLPKPAINSPFHMSYPYLFEHQATIYCIPETYQAREISLYQAQEFPHRWLKVATLIQDIAGLDTTVFQYDALWWLTHTDKEQGEFHNLFVWYAPDILGPWKPHAANPVKTDVRSARPAGTPFIYKGHLYRPAQDCSRTYGRRITLNRVTRLTPTEFREEPVGVIEPYASSPFSDGLHTVSAVGDFTLIDGRRRVFVPSGVRYYWSEILHKW